MLKCRVVRNLANTSLDIYIKPISRRDRYFYTRILVMDSNANNPPRPYTIKPVRVIRADSKEDVLGSRKVIKGTTVNSNKPREPEHPHGKSIVFNYVDFQ